MIIDDHPAFREVARELLQRRGFAVVAEADCATSGLETAERVAPEAVLLDVRLPDGNGFEVCHALLRRDPDLAVLLVSAGQLHRRPEHVLECGARGFLPKSRLASSDLALFLTRAREE